MTIKLPDFNKAFEFENNFYLSCNVSRISKILAHYEIYKLVYKIPGNIVECGVFKGASFARFVCFRTLFNNPSSKKIIGFDMFDKFSQTKYLPDKKPREEFIGDAGEDCISKEQLIQVLQHKGIYTNIELIQGDITKTVPEYLKQHPELKISLLNLDMDFFEPTVTVLENFYPRITRGGIIALDDYGFFPGATKATDDYFKHKDVQIQKMPFAMSPSYIIVK